MSHVGQFLVEVIALAMGRTNIRCYYDNDDDEEEEEAIDEGDDW